MHTIYIHIDETLDERELTALKEDLQHMEAVSDVEVNARLPHDMLVEYEETRITPMAILRELQRCGVHGDVMPC